MAKLLFITGCAGTGTTLMRRLFMAFRDVEVLEGTGGEIGLEDFIKSSSDKSWLIGKRRARCIFSRDAIADDLLERQAGLIRRHKVKVLNMIRDGRDVILSRANMKPITPKRWIHTMRHRRRYGDLIAMEIRYEDVVRYPQKVQMDVARRFGMRASDRWLDYPGFVPAADFSLKRGPKDGRYAAREITDERVGKDLGAYRRMIGDKVLLRHFEEELRRANYI